MKNTDIQELKKALDVAGAGAQLQQPLIQEAIEDLIERNNPLRQNLPRKPGEGSDYIVNRRTARGASLFVNDTETPPDSQSTYDQLKFPFKTILYPGRVTRRLQAQGKSLLDIQAEEIESGTQSVRDSEENAIINGNATGNPKEFDGLRTLIPVGQTVDAGNAALTLERLDEAIDKNRGRPNMMIMSRLALRKLRAILQQSQRFQETVEVKGGFVLLSYSGIPIFDSNVILNNQGGGNSTDIFIIDTERVFMSDLTPLQFDPVGTTTSQFKAFDIYEDSTLVLANNLYASRLADVDVS